MKQVKIKFVDLGVANRFDMGDYEVVEMNWRLKNYPDLYNRILQHEMGHEEGGFKFKDLKHDMLSRTPGLFKFMLHNPSALWQLMPIYYDTDKRKIVYDVSSIVSWLMVVCMATSVYYVLGWLL